MATIKSYPNNVDVEIGAENVMRWHHGRTSGVYGGSGQLAVAALGTPAMKVTVSDGDGWLSDGNYNGIHFWLDVFASTAALLQLNIDTADGVLSRIDRVIAEWSIPNYTQLPEIKILKGTNSLTPVAPALTNNSSTRQISLARIAVAAGTLAITAAMITDERFDATVCGIVTETTEVDTSMATAQFNEVLTEAQNLVNDLQGEAVIDHSSTHEPGGDDVARFVFYGGAQTLTDEQKAQARLNTNSEEKRLVFSDQSITTSGWATFTGATGEELKIQNKGFIYRKSVVLSGVLATMDVFIIPSSDIDDCGTTIQSIVIPYDGGVKIYAKSVPTAAFTLLRINCMKAGG